MAFTFQKGTTVIISNGTTSRELLVGSVSASQTYLEESRSVKTLHNPNNILDTYTNSKSPVSIEMECHLTRTDSLLLEWFGFVKVSGKYHILPAGTVLPVLDVYVKANGTTYKVSSAYATTLSIRMDKSDPLSITVSATGSNMTTVASAPSTNLTRQTKTEFIHGSISVAGYSNVGGVTCEITKQITWTNDKTIHAIMGGIHLSSRATCQDLAIGGSITNYKRDNSLGHTPITSIVIDYSGMFKLHFDKCKTLDRWDLTGHVHKKITDYKLLPISGNAYVQDTSIPPAYLQFIVNGEGF